MGKLKMWCGETFLKARWNIEGIPCETEEEFEAALANSKNVKRVWGGDRCFYELSLDLGNELAGKEWTEAWFDETKYVNFKLTEPPHKPKQSIPFWANDWRKKHKR